MSRKQSVGVTLEGVSKVFKNIKGKTETVAVHDASFGVSPGELVTLLGPSGCGKTTTLRMIGGFELPTAGEIRIGQENVTMLPPNQRDTATVFQSYGLFPHLNVEENISYGLKLRKLSSSEIEQKVNEILVMVGLEKLKDRSPAQLSGGQQQRVALARSLIVEPSVLLLDEPLSNLDALLREQMRVEIRRIQKSLGITAIYVTHDRVEAMSLSDRVIVMKDGEIKQTGTPQQIYEDPVSQFVAGFVGKVAFFPVDVLDRQGRVGAYECRLGSKIIKIQRAAEDVEDGQPAVVMARPESLRLVKRGLGIVDGLVHMNVYLGNSIETFVHTQYGEVLVQIDDPRSKQVFAEGQEISIEFDPDRVRLLKS